MYLESHKAEAVPAIVAIGAAATIIFALRSGVFPFFWIWRSAQPILFWSDIALTFAVGAGVSRGPS